MKTPYFLIKEKELLNNINNFKEAFEKLWPNYKIAYSVKTNSLPWILKYLEKNGVAAETVSDEEYELCKLCGFQDNNIIFNGPIKTRKQLKTAIENGAIVNLDSKNDIDFIKKNKFESKNISVGIRLNINTDIFNDEDIEYKNNIFRFGFCEENGEFKNVIDILRKTSVEENFGLHIHVNTITRSINSYRAIARYTSQIIKKYKLIPSFIDLGGGFFGGVPGKPTATEYVAAIKEELKDYVDVNKTKLIVEPGSAIVGSIVDFCTSVLDVKDIKGVKVVTTDGSRINIDPLWLKKKYLYTLYNRHDEILQNKKINNKQIICGYTCMDHDRIMNLEDEKELKIGDKITYHKVGNYTMTFGGMFIRYYPEVYVQRENGSIEKVRRRITVKEYKDINSL